MADFLRLWFGPKNAKQVRQRINRVRELLGQVEVTDSMFDGPVNARLRRALAHSYSMAARELLCASRILIGCYELEDKEQYKPQECDQ